MRAPASLIRFSGPDAVLEPPILERPNAAAPAVFVARIPDGWAWANDVRDLWDTGLVPKRWDRTGIAGWLWRGTPVTARLPYAGVQSVPPGEAWRLTTDGPVRMRKPATPIVPTTPVEVQTRLVEWMRASGATEILDSEFPSCPALLNMARSVGLDLKPVRPDFTSIAKMASRVLDGEDVGLEARVAASLGGRTGPILSGVGGNVLFGAHFIFAHWQRMQSWSLARWRKPRPGGDPMDVKEQRRRELNVYRDIPVNCGHSYVTLLPAATREAISTVGPRPADGLMPTGRGVEIVSEVAWSHAADWTALLREAGVHCPFLDEDIVRAVRGLSVRDRFARPGSGGLLPRWAAGFQSGDDGGGALEACLRGESADRLAAALAPDRLAERGILRPEAVARALSAWHQKKLGWTSRAVYRLAEITLRIERYGLEPPGD